MTLFDVVALISALGSGLIGGVFFAFSVSVMKALASVPPAHGIAAMQTINIVIINPWFLTPFMGTALTCAVMIAAAVMRWQQPETAYWLTGGLFYLLGTFGVTMIFNVPRNNALATAAPASPEGATLWAAYLSTWTAWNHVRTAAALVAAALFTIALT